MRELCELLSAQQVVDPAVLELGRGAGLAQLHLVTFEG
jgi:hypothetical protein